MSENDGSGAEARYRREWLTDVQCRLGLVVAGRSPHRARVARVAASQWPWEQFPGSWSWSCRFAGCFAGLGARYPTWDAAMADATAHPMETYKELIEAMFPRGSVRWLPCGDRTTGPDERVPYGR